MNKKGNLGNVAMGTCPICKKPSCIILQTREGKDAFDGRREVPTGEICDACQTLINENVALFCDACGGLTVMRAGALGMEPGSKFKIHKCQPCTKAAFPAMGDALQFFDIEATKAQGKDEKDAFIILG